MGVDMFWHVLKRKKQQHAMPRDWLSRDRKKHKAPQLFEKIGGLALKKRVLKHLRSRAWLATPRERKQRKHKKQQKTESFFLNRNPLLDMFLKTDGNSSH